MTILSRIKNRLKEKKMQSSLLENRSVFSGFLFCVTTFMFIVAYNNTFASTIWWEASALLLLFSCAIVIINRQKWADYDKICVSL